MGEGTLQRGVRASDREIARRKNKLTDLTTILLVCALVSFVVGFGSVSAPVATGAILWIISLVMFVSAALVAAYKHFS